MLGMNVPSSISSFQFVIGCTALKSGFFLLDSCIRVASSEVSSWAVMVDLEPLKSSEQLRPENTSRDTYLMSRK